MASARATSETHAIRESLLAVCVDRPRSAARMFARVREEWGEIEERRLWRALRWLIENGFVLRVGIRVGASGWSYGSDGYVRATAQSAVAA